MYAEAAADAAACCCAAAALGWCCQPAPAPLLLSCCEPMTVIKLDVGACGGALTGGGTVGGGCEYMLA